MFEIQSLSKYYSRKKKKIQVLKNITLSIKKGEIFGIIGLSGAGKSTLIRCLATLIKPTSGRILFQGQDISHLEGKKLHLFRKQIGMIFQHFNLFTSRTVEENIAYPLEISHISKEKQSERIDELLGLINLTDKRHMYPSQLSGGEKQRVGIARALANHPQVLLCDEATSALDPKTTKEILQLLRTINQETGVTIILITHEMDVIKQICHKVAVLEEGQIVESGDVAEIFSDPKQSITEQLLQGNSHQIPSSFFQSLSATRKLLRLRFKGQVAGHPLISQLVRRFNVDANILLGWIDHLQTTTIGTLIIELTGSQEGIHEALSYLQQNNVNYEILHEH